MHPSGSVSKVADVLLFGMECCVFVASRHLVALGMAVLVGWVAAAAPDRHGPLQSVTRLTDEAAHLAACLARPGAHHAQSVRSV